MDAEVAELASAGHPVEVEPHSEELGRERNVAVALTVVGFVAAAAASPFDRDFLPNFSFYWGPQGVLLALLLASRPRPALLSGTAFALALHFVAFDAWIHMLPSRESLAWLYYLFSFPGALVGALSAALVARRFPRAPAARVGAIAAALTAAGIALNYSATRLTGGFGL